MADFRKVSFEDPQVFDDDLTTDMELLKGKKTWSKKQFERITKIFDQQPSRKKILTEIQNTKDLQFWTVNVYNTTLTCAKVLNPTVLELDSGRWDEIATAQRLEVEDPEGIMTEIPKHLALELKNMDSFSMTWTNVKTLPNSLFHSNLRTLNVPRNQIKSLNGIEMAEHLENLDASSNMITALPNGIGQLHNLVTLNLSGNGIKELPVSMGSLGKLKTLYCSCNKLKALPDSISNMLELTILDVSNNYVNHLPDTIGNLPKLEDLRARSNHLCRLPENFGNLEKLKSVLLGKNQFEEVPEQLSSLPALQNLNMKDNRIKTMRRPIASLKSVILDGNLFMEIEKTILQCSSLQMLWMQNNKLHEIPSEIKLLKNLRALHLSGNRDISAVPNSMAEMEQLKHISLCSTRITNIPPVFASMQEMTVQLDDFAIGTDPRNTVSGVSRIQQKARTVGPSFDNKPKNRGRLTFFPGSKKTTKERHDNNGTVRQFDNSRHASIYPPKKGQESYEMKSKSDSDTNQKPDNQPGDTYQHF